MQQDLFNKKQKARKTISRQESSLKKYDANTLQERVDRLKYINSIFPKGSIIAADLQTVYIFSEAKMAFINGEFISTILLSQAFIERFLQSHYQSLGLDNIARRGLKAIIDHAQKNTTIHQFLLTRIDELRKVRNPFVHLKEFEHEYNLSQRVYKDVLPGKPYKQPIQIIADDAKEAIRLMYAIFSIPLS